MVCVYNNRYYNVEREITRHDETKGLYANACIVRYALDVPNGPVQLRIVKRL